ncbi:MAG: U32 family peptidase [Clostridia bacterium]|nr:U32 family peptidase [Clostridia bacterium]
MVELLAPAGNYDKLKAAVRYGADAIYIAGKIFGMRSAAENFTEDELRAAVEYAHGYGRKVYITVNTMPHTDEYPVLKKYLQTLETIRPDALIVADPGVFMLAKQLTPSAELHISTQAGTVSAEDCLFWRSLGAKRAVLARELSLDDIIKIRKAVPDDFEIETFVHGSMCVSFSGRCLLSNALTGRDGNRGACAQPCRWNYTITEEKRPDTPLPIEQTNDGTFIMSSKDMCMIEHIPELVEAGISSLKIEGRMKSVYYTAVVTNAYRAAIDGYLAKGKDYVFDKRWLDELESVSHREYSTGYFFDLPTENAQTCRNLGYIRDKAYLATAEHDAKAGERCLFKQKNKFVAGDEVELISPGKFGRAFKADEIYGENGEPIPSTPHPEMKFYLVAPFDIKAGDILRGAK